jgi:hypothetical protein
VFWRIEIVATKEHRGRVGVVSVLDEFRECRGIAANEKFAELPEKAGVNGELRALYARHDNTISWRGTVMMNPGLFSWFRIVE